MGWHYRSPKLFPALYSFTMRKAVQSLGTPILLFTNPSFPAREADAEDFRRFRWCIRQRTGIDTQLEEMENLYQFQLSTDVVDDKLLTYLTANPTKFSVLHDLNPHLRDIIKSNCQ